MTFAQDTFVKKIVDNGFNGDTCKIADCGGRKSIWVELINPGGNTYTVQLRGKTDSATLYKANYVRQDNAAGNAASQATLAVGPSTSLWVSLSTWYPEVTADALSATGSDTDHGLTITVYGIPV